jgi:hypothetical protein
MKNEDENILIIVYCWLWYESYFLHLTAQVTNARTPERECQKHY